MARRQQLSPPVQWKGPGEAVLIAMRGLTLDRAGRHVAVGTVDFTNGGDEYPYDVTLDLGPRSGGSRHGQGVELEAVTYRRRPGGVEITPRGVQRFPLAQLVRRVARSLPVYEMSERGVLIVDSATATVVHSSGPPRVEVADDGTVGGVTFGPAKGFGSLSTAEPYRLQLVDDVGPRPRRTADELVVVAQAWLAASGSDRARDRAAADAVPGWTFASVRQWRFREDDRWAAAIAAARATRRGSAR